MNKKQRKILSAILIVLVIIVGSLGAYGIYVNSHKDSQKTEKTSTKNTSKKNKVKNSSSSKKDKKTKKSSKKSSISSSSTSSSSESTSSSSSSKSEADKTSSSDAKNMTRQNAVDAATQLLKAVQKAPDGKMSEADRIKALKNNTDPKTLVGQDAWDKIYLSDFMGSDKRGAKLTAQALLNVVSSIESSGNNNLTPSQMDYNGAVYLDTKTKTAYVPLNLYTNASTNISLEMIYVDGQWKLSPFSLISEISIRVVSNDSIKGTPEADENSSSNSGTLPNQSSSSSSAN